MSDPSPVDALIASGRAAMESGQLDTAIEQYRQVLRAEPGRTDALANLGNALQAQGNFSEAISYYAKAIRSNDALPELFNNFGVALMGLGRVDDAIQKYRQALSIRPDYPEALTNIGNALQVQGNLTDSLAMLERALLIDPNYPEGHFNEAITRLRMGDLETGWRKYEWRWKMKGVKAHNHPQPPWDGASLEGKTIFIHWEQGLGDSLQFIRYVRLVKLMGAKVVVLCQKNLARLFTSVDGIDVLVADGVKGEGAKIPHCDYKVPLLSLPMLFKTTLSTIPADVPYLHPEPDLTAAWGRRVSALPGLKVGLCWAAGDFRKTGPRFNELDRSIRLTQFAPLADVPGVTFVSLQKGYSAEQAANAPPGLPLTDWATEMGDFSNPAALMANTAALVANLDLIISVDTSIAHLAGALGRPVWLLLRRAGQWRWLAGREDCPWYPTMRVFNQSKPGDWTPVIATVRDALTSLSEHRAAPLTVRTPRVCECHDEAGHEPGPS